MSVLFYVANARLPTEKAHGYQITQMCQAFKTAGAATRLLYPRRRNPLETPLSLEQYYGLRAPLHTEALSTIDLVQEGARGCGGRLGPITYALQTYSFGLAALAYLRRHADPTAILYTRDLHLADLLMRGLPRNLASRVVLEVHALSERPERRERQAQILARARAVVTVTGAMREQLLALGLPPERVAVAHDAVDLPAFDLPLSQEEARARLDLPQDQTIAAFVGKFHTNGEEKGIPEILRATTGLLADFPTLRFYFVGGPLDRLARYEAILTAEGLPRDRFVFIEKRPIQEVPLYLKASDILLMPHPWSEFYAHHVSPLKLFEYMASERPIVASALPAIQEVLTDRYNALLGTPGDPAAIAANLRTALTDPALAERVAAQAHADVQAHTWDRRAQAILQFIDKDPSSPCAVS